MRPWEGVKREKIGLKSLFKRYLGSVTLEMRVPYQKGPDRSNRCPSRCALITPGHGVRPYPRLCCN